MGIQPQIEVRKDVPVPEDGRAKNGGLPGVYPWRRMAVGESFLFPADVQINKASANVRGVNLRMASTGVRFVCRSIKDGPDAGRIGCWRVA